MSTTSDELRAAAKEIRRLAMGAPANNQPWRYAKGSPSDSVRTATGWEVAYGDAPGDLRYIAAMHPSIGLALADWLDEEADRRDASLVAAIQIWGNAEHPDAVAWLTTGLGKGSGPALDLARQINTGSRP